MCGGVFAWYNHIHTHTEAHTMTVIFNDLAEVAIFFGLMLMTFTEVFFGRISMALYNNPSNRDWYDTISYKIRGMPPRFLFPIVWTLLYSGIVIGMFLYYRGETFPNSGYMIDTITLLFLTNIMLLKIWPFVFFKLRKTIYSLAMIVFIVVLSLIMTVLFGVHEMWGSFVPFLVLTLWCCYALYLNATWVYIEKYMLRSDLRSQQQQQQQPIYL